MRILVVGAVSLCAAGALAGCRGSTDRLSHPQLVAEVNAVCREAGQPYGGARPTDAVGFHRFLAAQIPAERAGLARLEKLQPPTGDQRGWSSQIIEPERAQLADAVAAERALRQAAEAGDQQAASLTVRRTTDRLDQRGLTINGYWKSNGMTDCLNSPL